MLTIEGQYNSAKIFTNTLEASAAEQIQQLCDQPVSAGSKIRIMPDVHSGAGCTIGTTMTISEQIIPNLVGVDIGCGMEVLRLKNTHLELQKLDKLIYANIPSGFKVRKSTHPYAAEINLQHLRCRKKVDLARAEKSIGTLGGGNHFIEVNQGKDSALYLVIHSGSRHLGRQVADYYQKQAVNALHGSGVPAPLCYVEGALFDDYIHDMQLVQKFAVLNRKAMMDELVRGMKLKAEDEWTTIHNYIDTNHMILRKGAVSALASEKLLIPMNMHDGSLICRGKGNPDWNWSAPHGAGRLMSRTEAKNRLSMSSFRAVMQGIYTTSVNQSTLDECPQAYKPMDEIVSQIGETVEILDVIRPIYNFKAAG